MINHPRRSKKNRAPERTIAPHATPRPPRRPSSAHVDHGYDGLLYGIGHRFLAISYTLDKTLFLTDATNLNQTYLDALPSQRQHHTCSACRRFIETYGSLATIDVSGSVVPVMWDPDHVPAFYRPAVDALAAKVRSANVTSVFLSKHPVWGLPTTGEWRHMAVTPSPSMLHRDRALTPGQAMAAARENVKTVFNAMAEFSPAVLDEALRVLESGHLDRAEKFVGPVRWLRALHDWPKGRAHKRERDNLLWRAVASAPEGYCHIKSSVVAPLLDDIRAGVPFAELQRKHAAKVAPTIYQRPQAAPSAGNIAAAEKLFEKLGLAPALARRFARLEEVIPWALWTPWEARRPAAATGGIFGHLDPKGSPAAPPGVGLPPVTVTWEKFVKTVIGTAERIEIRVPPSGRFIALTTAVHAEAPPILKWDRDGQRNPVAWYVYPNGSSARQWFLFPDLWFPLTAVVPFPTLWGDPAMPFIANGVVMVIKGCCDTKTGQGNAIFPETLRDDLHGVRSTIEAYSKSAALAGRDEATACGYDVRNGNRSADCMLRVMSGGSWTVYQIDRWD